MRYHLHLLSALAGTVPSVMGVVQSCIPRLPSCIQNRLCLKTNRRPWSDRPFQDSQPYVLVASAAKGLP